MNRLSLKTDRLQLRPLTLNDEKIIHLHANNRAIADSMISIPYPFTQDEATGFVLNRRKDMENERGYTFVIESMEEQSFIGIAEIRHIDRRHRQAELSFWLAQKSWGKGYMSGVIKVVMDFCFLRTNLNRLCAFHMLRNPASGKVLKKSGFTHEGTLRQRAFKLGKFEDVALWAILKSDYEKL